ncbi:MAG: Hsp20/alpha crystallin family protein [Deltaproteobacteria bacterium]|nr:Hsp20/alpha crystallin family protein [Deltaproteobacteria bacterium]
MFELKKWDPIKELSGIQRDMDDLFRRVFGGLAPTSLLRREAFRGEWYPAIDCYMKNNQFIVHADLPGVNPKDVDISLTGNVLTIRGERKSEVEEKKEGYLFHETSFGTFERVLTIPEGVDVSKVKATYRNGVLELSMPAKAEALPKKVNIEIEAETKKAA